MIDDRPAAAESAHGFPFETLFDQAAVGMCFVALDGTFLRANRRLCEIVGYAPHELTSLTCTALTHPQDHPFEAQTTARMVRGEMPSATWEKRFVRKDGEPIWCNLTLTVLHDERGLPTQFAAVIEDITERKIAVARLEQSESLLRLASRTARFGAWSSDLTTGAITWSEEVNAIFEAPLGIVLSRKEILYLYVPESRERLLEALRRCSASGEPYALELEIRTLSGRHRWLRAVGQRESGPARLVGAVEDITARKEVELEMRRVNRALKILSGCNEVLVRARDERQLLDDICKLVVDVGGYIMAWVGYARDDGRCSVEPVASAGVGEGYLETSPISWSANEPTGWGSAGQTIRAGRPVVCDDIGSDSNFALWHDAARQSGFRSVVALPLRDPSRTFGVLCLYANELPGAPEIELNLLQELADDLAFGIAHLRTQADQKRAHDAVLKIATAVSARSSTEFFERLAVNMADAVGAHAAFIARPHPKIANFSRTIVAVVDGDVLENFDFKNEGSPAVDLRADIALVVADCLRERYPQCPTALAMDWRSLIGWRLDDSTGANLGMLFVLFAEPLVDYTLTTSTLKIFVSRAAAELERQISDARIADQASWLDKARDAIVVRDVTGRISFWNKSAERLYGWSFAEVRGTTIPTSLAEESTHLHEATAGVVELGFWNGEVEHRCKDGSTVRVESRWTIMRDADGEARSILSIDTDITQRKAAEREIENLAFFDTLTGLPNRLLLLQRLKTALSTGERIGALLFIDLDNFKTLNDTLGHDQGDILLQQVARRLLGCVRTADTVARLGGDEFIVMLCDLGETRDEASTNAKIVAENILVAFHAPYRLGAYDHDTTPSIGITVFGYGDNTDDLLKAADLAMYQAKASGRNAVRLFDPRMAAVVTARRALEDDIRFALRANSFSLALQPQIDAAGVVIGAEALVRWRHAVRGMIPPVEFIPVAEDSGLIVPLGRRVLRSACEQLVTWSRREVTAALKLSVNVSAREFRQTDFVVHVTDILTQTGAKPQLLALELTESVLVDDIEIIIAKMTALKAIGVNFSLDDFGTGYSSLAYLKRLPLDQLKIDQSFVRDILVDSNDATIARTIITLGASLGLDVVAEGVETHQQRKFLATHGCRFFQGNYFSGPLVAEDFEAFVDERAFDATCGFPRAAAAEFAAEWP